MEILLLIFGIIFIACAAFVISADDDKPEKGVIFGLTLVGALCIAICVSLYNKSRDEIINQSELSNRKIIVTITNENDTICDTTYVYEPKR